jgi:iron(III) transport system substrate-binding protein
MGNILFLFVMLAALIPATLSAKELVVYTSRKAHLIKPVFEEFTKETGIKVSFTTDKAPALIAKLKAEGKRTPADVLVTVDAGNLWQATQEGVLQPFDSQVLKKAIPAHLRDPKGHWFGFSLRARTIVYNKSVLPPEKLKDYQDLADPKWKGKLCLRTSKKVYNQSLVAMMLSQFGQKTTEKIVKGWVANLATGVFPNDTALIKAIAAGKCQVGIVNTYYLGRLLKENPKLNVGLFWPKAENGGVHVNISGAGLVKFAKHPLVGQNFLEWLSKKQAQKIFADMNLEFPIIKEAPLNPICKAWGPFHQNKMPLIKAGEYQARAIILMDVAGYK